MTNIYLPTGNATLAGVAGWPVSHSRSPRLHGFWLQHHRIDGAYVPLPITPEDFPSVLPVLRRIGFRGLNVTIPHKEVAYSSCTVLTEAARAIGAVNTIVFGVDSTIHGDNTDGFGFLENLRLSAPNWDPAERPVLVLGAGGAARAVVHALLEAKVPQIHLSNRSIARAELLASGYRDQVMVLPWDHRMRTAHEVGLLVNTTSLGMAGHAALEFDVGTLADDAIVNDLVYTPLETPLLAAARARGLVAIDGLGCCSIKRVEGSDHGLASTLWSPRNCVMSLLGRRRSRRLGRRMPVILGLTGSIGMGKSTVAEMFRGFGVPIHDADAAVHRLMGSGGRALPSIRAAFPDVVGQDGVDRAALGKIAFADPRVLKRLQTILHPMVREDEKRFLLRHAFRGTPVVVLDIPLLFETKGQRRMDAVIVVSAPKAVQVSRVLRRPGMTENRLAMILRKQLPDVVKRRHADVVIPTGIVTNGHPDARSKNVAQHCGVSLKSVNVYFW